MGVFSAMLLLLISLPPLWAKGPAANRKGVDAFRKGNYEEAGKQYGKASEALPGDRVVAYNQGTSLLKQKKYDEALKSLMAGAGDTRREVKSASLYNAGNALADGQKLPEALSAYRQAILADPNDMDAKFNYELARRKLEQGQDEENKDDQNKDDKNEDKNQQQDNKDQQDQEQKDQEQDQEQQQGGDENEDKAQQSPDQPKPEEGDEQQGAEDQKPQPAARLTKEQAERLLDALKDNEMEMIKARLKSKRKKNVEKDW